MAEENKPAAQAKTSGRSWRWIYYLVVLIIIAVVVLYFTGHLPGVGGGGSGKTTEPPPVGQGYLAATTTSVIFLQWNQTGTATEGVAQMVNVQGQPPNETLAVKTASVTGVITKSNVSVDFKGIIQVFGTTSDKGFTLDFPQPDGSLGPVVFKQASAQDYNNALAALRAQVNSANQGTVTTPSS